MLRCRLYEGHEGACNPEAYLECSRMRGNRHLCHKVVEGPEPPRPKWADTFKMPLLIREDGPTPMYEISNLVLKPYEKPNLRSI